MSPLPKHLRPRWRYLGVRLESWPDATIDRRAFQREVWYAAQNLLGDPGSADADLTVVRFDFEGGVGTAVVRTRHDETGPARAALACVDEVDGHSIGMVVAGISGTIRACEEKYLGRDGQKRHESTVAFRGEERVAVVRRDRLDVRLDHSFVGATDLDIP